MKVTVRFWANIKQIAGRGELDIELSSCPNCSLEAILDEVNKHTSSRLCGYDSVREDGVPVRILVNGKLVHSLEKNNVEIVDGDSVTIFPLLASG